MKDLLSLTLLKINKKYTTQISCAYKLGKGATRNALPEEGGGGHIYLSNRSPKNNDYSVEARKATATHLHNKLELVYFISWGQTVKKSGGQCFLSHQNFPNISQSDETYAVLVDHKYSYCNLLKKKGSGEKLYLSN